MERLCFLMQLQPGMEAEYDRRHDELWPEMREALLASGFRNYSLFRRGSTVIGYAECSPDADTAFSTMSATDVDARWQESFAGIIATMTDDAGKLNRFPEVWHLDEG